VSSGGGLGLERAIRHDLFLSADAAYFSDNYQGTGRVDRLTTVSAGLRYYVTPNLFLGADYAYAQRDSNIPSEDYQENVVFVRLGAQALPAYTQSARRAEIEDLGTGTSGFYGGVQAGVTHFGTELEGVRGAGGSLTVDFAGAGFDAGVFGGYGATFGDWYLGLELELEDSNARWDHANVPLGREFSVEKGVTLGGGPIFGYRLPSSSMVYGRVGAMVTEFETHYATAGGSQRQSEGLLGFGGGVGAQVPLTDKLFFRLDYRYASYEDYELLDNFANNASSVRFGLGYGGHDWDAGAGGARGAKTTMDFTGAYMGGQVGFASLDSELSGARESGRNLSADFGDDGAMAGVFAGYGWTWQKLYLGLELEGEMSDGYGAGVRVGYIVDRSALLYARVGAVRSEFRTKYSRGSVNVERVDSQPGIRLGGGVELPVTDHAFVRMDYSYTRYEDYDLDYLTGIDNFRNSESAFQVGLGYRF
jgi:opacity protein-like surface antigen